MKINNEIDLDYIVKIKKENLDIKQTMDKGEEFIKIIILIGFLIFSLSIIFRQYAYALQFLLPITILVMIMLRKRWSLKIDEENLYINQPYKKYKINLKDIINIKVDRAISVRFPFEHCLHITVVYLKNNRIKRKKLYWKIIYFNNGSVTTSRLHSQCIADEDIEKIFKHFITKKQLEEDPTLKEKFNYIEVRNNEENIKFEKNIEKLSRREAKTDNAYTLFMLAIFCTMIALGVIFSIKTVIDENRENIMMKFKIIKEENKWQEKIMK